MPFLKLPHEMSRRYAKKREFLTRIRLRYVVVGNAAEFDVRRQRFGGESHEKRNHGSLPEHFIIRIDGRVKSHHRRFLDALRQGLQLRD